MFNDAADKASGSDQEDRERLLTDDEVYLQEQKKPAQTLSWVAIAVLLFVTASIAALAGAWAGSTRWRRGADAISCTRQRNRYSPVLDEVDMNYHVVGFNGSLLKENIFRQAASPEVDAAWASLGVDYRALAVPADKAAQSGIAPDQVKISDKYGGGFPANVEGLHQLHCLNLVRQSLYYNYDYYHKLGKGAFSNADHIVRKHVSHCLDIVRQQLMCTVDTGVLGQVWYKPASGPVQSFVDFNTQHKCRDFEAVRKWAEERQLPKEVPPDFLQPPRKGDTVYTTVP